MNNIIKTFTIKGEIFLRLIEVKNGKSLTYSIDDCTGNWTNTDNYTVWGNVVCGIKNKEDAIGYANYLLSDEGYEQTEMKYADWKKVFGSNQRGKSPLVDFALDIQESDFENKDIFDSIVQKSKVYITICSGIYGDYQYELKNVEYEVDYLFEEIDIKKFEELIMKTFGDSIQVQDLFENYTLKNIPIKLYVEGDTTYVISKEKIITGRLEKLIENEF